VSTDLIVVENLKKEFRLGLTRKRVLAVQGISFSVRQGVIFGFLGPNGAGKTTTIKMLTGLISPSAGRASLFGHPIPSAKAMRQIGFLPENPYIYPYLTPTEFVEMCGRLSGLRGKAVRARTRQVLDRVGILYAADRPARRLSKGMLQRTGLAAALVADPELLILDEPMSGLDPVGRKEVKDIIVEERQGGRTIFFSTHILSDVETLCDDVTIMRKGQIVVRGRLDELLRREAQRCTVVLQDPGQVVDAFAREAGHRVTRLAARLQVEIEGKALVQPLLEQAVRHAIEVESVTPRHETLEELFMREAIAGADPVEKSSE
jgi:ABC-2 type transport system ATP-binding protein